MLARIAKTIVWETARPYHYVRTTSDHRVLVGGEDDAHDEPAKRERRVVPRARALARYAAKLLPDIELTRAFAWAGTFAETRDALPYFGSHAQHGDRVLFAMAYGGNGITYSMLGASLLRAIIERTPHPLRALFAFERSYLSPRASAGSARSRAARGAPRRELACLGHERGDDRLGLLVGLHRRRSQRPRAQSRRCDTDRRDGVERRRVAGLVHVDVAPDQAIAAALRPIRYVPASL